MSFKEKNGEVKSRIQRKEQKKWKTTLFVNKGLIGKKGAETDHAEPGENDPIRVRLIPIWLRLVIIAVLFVLLVFIGAIIGYSVISEGSFTEVFQKSTWIKIFDLIEKE